MTKLFNGYARVRKDIAQEGKAVPVGIDKNVTDEDIGSVPYAYVEGLENSELFMININGEWIEAYSVDFDLDMKPPQEGSDPL